VSDDGVETNSESWPVETGYEPPEVFDFGSVFQVTKGSGGVNQERQQGYE
jgi:hypothetical protein